MMTTQGRLISSTLFNFIFDNMVRNWLAPMVEDQLVAQEGLGLAVGRCLGLFYADSSVVGSRDKEWLQGALNGFIGLFFPYGLAVNVANPKAMTCHLGNGGKVVTKTGSTLQERCMLYKAAVQSVFLYGSERWVVTGDILRVLEGFHHRVAI